MVTIYKLNKLTTKQLDSIRQAVTATRGTRCKAEKFAQVLSGFATKEVEQPRVSSRIARVHTYNFGSNEHHDRRPVFIDCGRFVGWSNDHNSVVTTDDYTIYSRIYSGYIINLTDVAMQQLMDEFCDYVK